jgi:hypothetical protein
MSDALQTPLPATATDNEYQRRILYTVQHLGQAGLAPILYSNAILRQILFALLFNGAVGLFQPHGGDNEMLRRILYAYQNGLTEGLYAGTHPDNQLLRRIVYALQNHGQDGLSPIIYTNRLYREWLALLLNVTP